MFDVDVDLEDDDIARLGTSALRRRSRKPRFPLIRPERRPILERLMTALRTPICNMI